jgi:hypothetical protein
MGLYTWNKPLDPYDYVQLTDNWNRVDYHDHTPGRGVQIPSAGIAPGAVGPLQLSFVASQIGSWTSLVPYLTAGVVAGTGGYAPSVRIEGNNDVVRFKGFITNSSGSAIGAGSTIIALPASLHPTASVTMNISSGTAAGWMNITTSGNLSISGFSFANGGSLVLDGLTYTLS